jgi:hypothetical protein
MAVLVRLEGHEGHPDQEQYSPMPNRLPARLLSFTKRDTPTSAEALVRPNREPFLALRTLVDVGRARGYVCRRRRRVTHSSGISTVQVSTAAQIRPAGVVRPVAVTEAQLPRLKAIVPIISSECAAAVDEAELLRSGRSASGVLLGISKLSFHASPPKR